MAKLNQKDLINLMQLCHIHCNEETQKRLLNDLQKIINYMTMLQEVDTTHIEPCNHVLANVVNALRQDVVEKTISRSDFLENAPSHIGGMIKVPIVIKPSS